MTMDVAAATSPVMMRRKGPMRWMMHESELTNSRVCSWRHICRTARTTARDTFLVGLIAVIGTVDYTRTHMSECVQHMYRACKYYDGFEMLMTEVGRIWGILRKGSIHCRRKRRISSLSVSFIQRNFIFRLHGLALRNRFAPQQKSHLARKDA